MANREKWYFEIEGKTFGPVSKEELRFQLDAGFLDGDDLVWTPGAESWRSAVQAGLAPPKEKDAAAEADGTSRPVEGTVGMRSEPSGDDGPHAVYPSPWRRLSAYLLDELMVVIISIPFVAFLPNAVESSTGEAMGRVVGLAIVLGYFGILQAALEGSPGKRLLRMRLVRDDLTPLTAGVGIRRVVYLTLAALPLGLGVLSVFWNPRRQGWYDRRGRTLVVSEPYFQKMRKRHFTPA